MNTFRRHSCALSDERGSVVVVVGMIAIVFVFLGTVIIELGHTMEHRRHLQLQTDAAALAAAQAFSLCATNPGGAYTAMSNLANQYGGFSGSNQFNQQVGTGSGYAGTISSVYQSRTYPPGGAGIGQDPDDIFHGTTQQMTCGDPSDTTCLTQTINPCQMFDVKATEAGVHNVFNFGLSSTVHAHSRVELKAVNEANGLLPLAVPDVRPQFAFAKFVAETGTISCTGQTDPLLDPCEEELVRDPTDTAKWIPKGGNLLDVTVPTSDMGVRIRLVGGNNKYAACGTLFVDCYEEGTANGVVHVRGYSTAASAQPIVRSASLLNGTCAPDAYFAAADCSAGITADIDLGPTNTITASTAVWATVDGGGQYQLTTSPKSGTGLHTWSAASGIPITGTGPHVIALTFSMNGHGSGTSLGNVQRAYEADPTLSGPLQSVQIYESGSTFGPYSYPGGSTHTLGATIRTSGVLLLSQVTDPPINLRVFKGGASASQDQTVDCQAADNLSLPYELQYGCTPLYKTSTNLDCSQYGNDFHQNSWGPQPWHCVPIITGDRNAQIDQGLNLRIFGKKNTNASDCGANSSGRVNWIKPANATPTNPAGFDETKHLNDKRVLPLFVTPFGSFGGNGNTNVPIIDFGYFYVTGYSGDPCETTDPNDDASLIPNGGGGKAFVLGHFIKFFPVDDRHVSNDNCDLTTITPCVGVLTR